MLNTNYTPSQAALPPYFVPSGEFDPALLFEFSAGSNDAYQAETPPKRKYTSGDFRNAKECLNSFVVNRTLSPREAAEAYESAWPDLTAEPLRYSKRRQGQKAWRAFYGEKENDTQRMTKLFACLDRPCRYIITAKDLDLPQEFEISARFYDKKVNEAWKKAIEKLFNTKNRNNVIWFKLEVGEAGKIHAHIFASHDAALQHLPRGTTPQHKVRLVETPEDAVSYLLKPALSDSTEHLALWIDAKRQIPKSKHLPTVSGFRNLPNRRTWGKA